MSKLVSYARANHISPHKLIRRIEQRHETSVQRGAMVALMVMIHAECAPQFAELNRKRMLLETNDESLLGREDQGYANRKDCAGYYEPYAVGHTRGSESLVSVESFEACALAGMSKGEDSTRNVSTCNV